MAKAKRAQVSVKKFEGKRENKSSQTKKTGPSQSISSPIDQILFLQRTIGNQAVGRLIKSGDLQAKLRIGQPRNIYEQEADRVAEQVMRMPEPQVSKETKISKEEDEKVIQMKEAPGSTPKGKHQAADKKPKRKNCAPNVIEYIKKNCQIAKTASNENCPYHIMLIQSGFENTWGSATNILKDNNYFGVHGEGDKGSRRAGKDPTIKLPIYSSAQQSFNAFCKRVADHKITYKTDSQFIADVVRLLKFSVGTEEKYKTGILDMINRCKKELDSCKEAKELQEKEKTVQ